MRKILLFALVFSAFLLMISYALASTIYDPPNEVYTWEWQEYGPRIDELYFKIADWDSVTPAQELYVDSFDAIHTGWTMVGDSPYLNVTDYPNSYVESSSYCSFVGFFRFEDMVPLEPGEEIKGVRFEAHAWSDDPEIDGDIYLFGSDFSGVYAGSIEASTTWSWDLADVYASGYDFIGYVDTPEKIADVKVLLHYWTPDGSSGPTMKIDALKLNVYTCTLEEVQVTAMQTGEIDLLTTSAYNMTELDQEGFTITKAPECHSCYIGFNMRKWPFMQDATGNALRHATAHLVPKEDMVEELFEFSWANLTSRWDNFLPPSQKPWLNPNIDKHPYSITEAVTILSDAGYTFIDNPPNQGLPSSTIPAGSEDYWLAPNGTQLPVMKILSPLYSEAWTSYTCVNMTVERMHAAGLTNVVHEPMAFYTYMDKLEHDHDFDMYWCCWLSGSEPSILYDLYHSSQDFPDGDNRNGIHDSTLDAELEVIHSSTDLAAIENAVSNAQMLLSELLPQVPVYSRNMIAALNPNLDGIVNTYDYGAENQWTFLNIHFQGIPLGGTLKWGLTSEPSLLNPANTDTYSSKVLDRIFDGLLAVNPETGEFMPWIATNWTVEPWMAPGSVPGMNITFWLRDDVCWQDNVTFTAEDVKFSLDYSQEHELARPYASWRGSWQNLVEVVVPPANPYVAQVYFNTSSYWLLYDVAEAATLFPKHIWENITDPLNFEPWNEPHPSDPELTQLIGTGPFYFVEYVPKDHVLLRANPNYFRKLPTSTSAEVGSTGGTVTNVAGTSSVEIPSGALTENTTITIEEYPTSEYGGFLINQSDNMVSYGVYDFGPQGTTFETDVTITLAYNETAVDESQLEQLVVFSSDDGVTWYQITIESVDTIENTITIKVDHFSLFVILLSTSPQEAIERLIADVEGMNLQQGIDNSLDAKLASALDALDALNADQRNDAVNKLTAFMNEVEAQRGKKLTNEQADYLAGEAQRIIYLVQG